MNQILVHQKIIGTNNILQWQKLFRIQSVFIYLYLLFEYRGDYDKVNNDLCMDEHHQCPIWFIRSCQTPSLQPWTFTGKRPLSTVMLVDYQKPWCHLTKHEQSWYTMVVHGHMAIISPA